MKFILEIDCNNADFEGEQMPVAVRLLLLTTAARLENAPGLYTGDVRDEITLRDGNGNTVGSAAFYDDDTIVASA